MIVIKFDDPSIISTLYNCIDINFIAAFDLSKNPSVVEACNRLDIPICDTNTKLYEGDMLREINSGIRYVLLSKRIPKLLHPHIIMSANTLLDIKNYARRSFGGILWNGTDEEYDEACSQTDTVILKHLSHLPYSEQENGWINFDEIPEEDLT